MDICVRRAKPEDLDAVNRIRKEVNDLHVAGRPDIFRPGFCREIEQHAGDMLGKPESDVIVAELDGEICGYVMADIVHKPMSSYNLERSYYHVEEIGVASDSRRKGIAQAMIAYIREDAREKGMEKIELDMWEFNTGALAFYEQVGFTTYRRYMEMDI